MEHSQKSEYDCWNENNMDPLVGVIVVVFGVAEVELPKVELVI
jgi:hypothetical protein